jgi:hypothetical protein
MSVHHAWHEDTTAGVNFHRPLWNGKLPPKRSDAIRDHKHIPILDYTVRGINGQHRGMTKDHRATGRKILCVCC